MLLLIQKYISLVMLDSDPRDGFFHVSLIPMIDSHILGEIETNNLLFQTVKLRLSDFHCLGLLFFSLEIELPMNAGLKTLPKG